MLLADFHFFKAPERPQPHIQDGFRLSIVQAKAFHQPGLRFIFFPDDADHLIQIKIGDQIAIKNLKPPRNRAQPVIGAPLQHLMPMIQPGAQHFLQAHDARRAIGIQHIHVQRKARFQRRGAEQRFHQHRRFHIARFGFQYHPHLFSAFIAQIRQQRQLLFFE